MATIKSVSTRIEDDETVHTTWSIASETGISFEPEPPRVVIVTPNVSVLQTNRLDMVTAQEPAGVVPMQIIPSGKENTTNTVVVTPGPAASSVAASSSNKPKRVKSKHIGGGPAEGLPDGWSFREHEQVGGKNAGRQYYIYISPTNKKFNSKKGCKKFIQILNEPGVGGDENRAYELFKARAKEVKAAKRQDNSSQLSIDDTTVANTMAAGAAEGRRSDVSNGNGAKKKRNAQDAPSTLSKKLKTNAQASGNKGGAPEQSLQGAANAVDERLHDVESEGNTSPAQSKKYGHEKNGPVDKTFLRMVTSSHDADKATAPPPQAPAVQGQVRFTFKQLFERVAHNLSKSQTEEEKHFYGHLHAWFLQKADDPGSVEDVMNFDSSLAVEISNKFKRDHTELVMKRTEGHFAVRVYQLNVDQRIRELKSKFPLAPENPSAN